MNKKLHLNEDILIPMEVGPDVMPAGIENIEKTSQESPEVLSQSTMINSMIKGEWDAIDLYNSMLQTFNDMGNKEAADTISDIVKEEYIHVGQLEKLLQSRNSDANSIEQGKAEAEETVGQESSVDTDFIG